MGDGSVDGRFAQLVPFAVALALGLLVGIERQRSHTADPKTLPGGIRTYPLVALLGCGAGWAHEHLGLGALLLVGAIFGGLVIASYTLTALHGDHGMATALASVLTFVFGLMAYKDHAFAAAALAITTTGLLSLRRPLHELTKKIEEPDLFAALKLAALTVVVLPVLPDHDFGPKPYDVFNPFKFWLFVVLIAALGFGGYVGTKWLGPGRGIAAAGALGGIVSSTALTVSFSGRSRETPEASRAFALGIAIAWAMMFGRVFLEVLAAAPLIAPSLAVPLVAATVAGVGGAAVLYWRARRAESPPVPYANPFSILSAVKFGLVFVAILFVARFAQLRFQDRGVIAVAALTGVLDVDAVTLSIAKLAHSGEVGPDTAVFAITTAVASNTVTKAMIVAATGARSLSKILLPVVAVTLVAGAGAVLVSR